MHRSYLLLFIHRLMIFTLTTNAIIIIIFIMYFHCIYWNLLWLIFLFKWKVFIQIVFLLYLLGLVFIADFIYLFIFIELDLIFLLFNTCTINLLFNTCTIKFIVGKFYFEGRACYIGKIMPTCIE